MTRTRLAAAFAALAVTGGAVTMLVTLVAGPGSWWQGYVSEAGTAGRPHAVAYRCGLILLASGVGLLAVALRRVAPAAGVCLAVAAALAGTSGVVSCTAGCPLPPYEPTTVPDVVHTAASILGMLSLAGAMAVGAGDSRVAARRLARAVLPVIVPLGAALGLTMAFAGRGTLGSVLERCTLVVAVTWLVGAGLLTAALPGPARPPGPAALDGPAAPDGRAALDGRPRPDGRAALDGPPRPDGPARPGRGGAHEGDRRPPDR